MQVEKSVFFETLKEIVLSGWLSGINEHPKIVLLLIQVTSSDLEPRIHLFDPVTTVTSSSKVDLENDISFETR
jgi:hypothetical protein